MNEDTETRLRAGGLRVTQPRLTVLAVLDDAATRREHLPAALIARRARTRLGALSTQTVYDCLDALAAARLARRIEPAGSPALYETRVGDNHHHLVCRDCGVTTDVDCVVGAAPCLTPSSSDGFSVDQAEVTFWGRCDACIGWRDDVPRIDIPTDDIPTEGIPTDETRSSERPRGTR